MPVTRAAGGGPGSVSQDSSCQELVVSIWRLKSTC